MNTQHTISTTQARKDIFTITRDVQKPGRYYTLTENGRPKAVLMSAEEFESWAETLEVLRDFPDLDKHVAETDKAVKSGEYKKWATLDDLKKDFGFVVADKSAKKYGVQTARRTKGAKKHT
ncbi:hypothetical protein BK004_01905 [bacterium CG10_46_32]|nr:MAG: hypothetical protein BK004_01905 [bacterium CG10_46_32]PIR56190.1 MAG: hypothetical protein COU73_01935 [Parcubacteria group bacterium CG10_big_fil_rev_8_21_14_0_10_46_32]